MVRSGGFIETIVAADPMGQAFRFLTHLLSDAQATGGAIVIEAERRPRVWVAINAAQADAVTSRWADVLKLLSGSGVHVTDGKFAAALRADDELVGVLHLEGAQSFDAARHADHLAVFARAIVAATTARPASYGVEDLVGGSAYRQRAVLLDLLNRSEWNVAFVAREMGTTRRTVYERMARFGIQRIRVPKHRRR